MNVLATTRFNSHTWNENKRWRDTHGLKGCIYGTPFQIGPKILLESTVYILEMHNDENKIKGIGMITNIPNVNKYYNIYSNKNYNRFTYKSEYRIDRDDMSPSELMVIKILDILLFTTSISLLKDIFFIKGCSKISSEITFCLIFNSGFCSILISSFNNEGITFVDIFLLCLFNLDKLFSIILYLY